MQKKPDRLLKRENQVNKKNVMMTERMHGYAAATQVSIANLLFINFFLKFCFLFLSR